MLELIFVRHGETDSNKRGTYCGWTDTGLNEKGVKQAKEAAKKLAAAVPDAIYSSPLARTMQTAQIINRNYGLDIISSESLKERNFGIWEDLTYEDICRRYPYEKQKWETDWLNYCMDKGESASQIFKRVIEFVQALINRHNSGRIMLVTHLGCIQASLAHFLGMPEEGIWRFRVDNCGITSLQVNEDGFVYLTGLNV